MPAQPQIECGVSSQERRLFDIRAAVEYLHLIGAESVTPNFVRTLIGTGQVKHVRMGRKFYITLEALEQWIGNHERRRTQ